MNRIILALFVSLTSLLALASNYAYATQDESNDPFYSSVPAAYMEDPRRNEWQKPDQVLEHLFVKPGTTVADIGAGTGFFSLHFARKTGKTGVVYASDIDAKMVQALEKRAEKEKIGNIRPILGKTDDPLIPRSSVDLLFICDTYLFIDNRVEYLKKLKESLKPDGRLAVISFNSAAEISGAPPPQRMIHKNIVIKEAIAAGYDPEADYLFLPFQDFLVFRKR